MTELIVDMVELIAHLLSRAWSAATGKLRARAFARSLPIVRWTLRPPLVLVSNCKPLNTIRRLIDLSITCLDT